MAKKFILEGGSNSLTLKVPELSDLKGKPFITILIRVIDLILHTIPYIFVLLPVLDPAVFYKSFYFVTVFTLALILIKLLLSKKMDFTGNLFELALLVLTSTISITLFLTLRDAKSFDIWGTGTVKAIALPSLLGFSFLFLSLPYFCGKVRIPGSFILMYLSVLIALLISFGNSGTFDPGLTALSLVLLPAVTVSAFKSERILKTALLLSLSAAVFVMAPAVKLALAAESLLLFGWLIFHYPKQDKRLAIPVLAVAVVILIWSIINIFQNIPVIKEFRWTLLGSATAPASTASSYIVADFITYYGAVAAFAALLVAAAWISQLLRSKTSQKLPLLLAIPGILISMLLSNGNYSGYIYSLFLLAVLTSLALRKDPAEGPVGFRQFKFLKTSNYIFFANFLHTLLIAIIIVLAIVTLGFLTNL
jgi:hypothetical protein